MKYPLFPPGVCNQLSIRNNTKICVFTVGVSIRRLRAVDTVSYRNRIAYSVYNQILYPGIAAAYINTHNKRGNTLAFSYLYWFYIVECMNAVAHGIFTTICGQFYIQSIENQFR